MLRMFGRNMTLGQCLRNISATKHPEKMSEFLFTMIRDKIIVQVK
jgi:hypothetical protein